MPRYGYARVSSTDQDCALQEARLRAAGCEVIRAERVSGKSRDGRGEHSKSWGADGVGLGSRLTRRGWAGAETGVAGEAGCRAAARRDDGDRGCPDRAR